MNNADADHQLPPPVRGLFRIRTTNPSIIAPEIKRMVVKLAGSIPVLLKAILQRIELLAKASMANQVRVIMRVLDMVFFNKLWCHKKNCSKGSPISLNGFWFLHTSCKLFLSNQKYVTSYFFHHYET